MANWKLGELFIATTTAVALDKFGLPLDCGDKCTGSGKPLSDDVEGAKEKALLWVDDIAWQFRWLVNSKVEIIEDVEDDLVMMVYAALQGDRDAVSELKRMVF